MILLGLYCGHDSNVCILRDGEVLAHIEGERITRRKHESGLIRGAVEAALRKADVSLEAVDRIALGGYTWAESIDPWPELAAVLKPVADAAASHLYTHAPEHTACTVLGGRSIPTSVIHHHVSHAALAYYTSPWSRVDVMSWDGGGDNAYGLRCSGLDGKLVGLTFNPPTDRLNLSIGGIWTDVGRLYDLGTDWEGKIMGHAAYGIADPGLVRAIHAWIANYDSAKEAAPWARRVGLQVDLANLHSESSKVLSASLQQATEEVMLEMLSEVSGPIALVGGCAYNCVANGRIFQQHPQVYVPSCPHDGGLALGAALYVWHHVLSNPFGGRPNFSPYLGSGTWQADKSTAPSVVDDLLAGKIVAWFDGPAESGKRALGARSILADPRNPAIKDVLNDKVKHREWFRPFAPSVLPERGEWCAGMVPPSPYMSFSCSVRPEWREKIPGIVHVDGTCRPQIVNPETNPVYHKIIRLFDEATDVPMILNTSFNVQEPIIDTPEQARATFAKSGIDVLYLNGERISK